MTASTFEKCLPWLLDSEGGNDDDPSDHGGRTSRGITQREYDAYRSREELPLGDVWRATDSEIKQIFYYSYWNPWCNILPTGVDYIFFDTSVLQGPYMAAKLLQRALGVTQDGHIGIVTMAALSRADRTDLIHTITQKRIRVFQSLRQPRFTAGWINRAKRVESQSLNLLGQPR